MALSTDGDLEARFNSVEELFEGLKRTKQVIAEQDEIIKQSKQNIEISEGIKRQANRQYNEIERAIGALLTPKSTRVMKVEDESPTRVTIPTPKISSQGLQGSNNGRQSTPEDTTAIAFPKLADPQWLDKAKTDARVHPSIGFSVGPEKYKRQEYIIYAKTEGREKHSIKSLENGVEYIIGSTPRVAQAGGWMRRAGSTLIAVNGSSLWGTPKTDIGETRQEFSRLDGSSKLMVWYERHTVDVAWWCDNFTT
ncbi:uncharacterized protein AB675_8000 [Cyphellophora attinorum]|uniref:Uncharacterized protein n=1 Tax=Cyphellophora attinorum TaxID=1664694 RepID=A0A0N0NMZ9_9EURO|nr:uncharacterized protein AB675_8000 [Phialophora attinorum]KPI41041.1 hypothetical protein AB675_8000 [Phialophora attinorum]